MIDFVYIGDVKPDETQRRCYDCVHLRGAVSLWCTNEEAVEARGTNIPGVRECDFWAPLRAKKDLSLKERLLYNPIEMQLERG